MLKNIQLSYYIIYAERPVARIRWPVGASARVKIYYLWPRDSYLWARDNNFYAHWPGALHVVSHVFVKKYSIAQGRNQTYVSELNDVAASVLASIRLVSSSPPNHVFHQFFVIEYMTRCGTTSLTRGPRLRCGSIKPHMFQYTISMQPFKIK